MEKKQIFIVETFERSTCEFEHSKQFNNWDDVLDEAHKTLAKIISRWNKNPYNTPIDGIDLDEVDEVYDRGGNIVLGGGAYVVGISDVTPEQEEYFEYVIAIHDVEMCPQEIKALEIPFESMDSFKDYLKRVVLLLGGGYAIYKPEQFDAIYNSRQDYSSDYPYIAHVKILR